MAILCKYPFFSENKSNETVGFSEQILWFFKFILGQPWFSVTSSRKVGCDLLVHMPSSAFTSTFPSPHSESAARFFRACPNQTHWCVCLPKCSNMCIYIQYTCNIISIYCLAASPKSWYNGCQNGLCRTLPTTPQDQPQSLYMNASPRPMLQSISSHTGIWPWFQAQGQIHDKLFNKKIPSPLDPTRFRYKIQTAWSIETKQKSKQLYIGNDQKQNAMNNYCFGLNVLQIFRPFLRD